MKGSGAGRLVWLEGPWWAGRVKIYTLLFEYTYYFTEFKRLDFVDYQWKYGRKGGTSQVLNLRCYCFFFGRSRLLPLG
jgi:hypothetical protein